MPCNDFFLTQTTGLKHWINRILQFFFNLLGNTRSLFISSRYHIFNAGNMNPLRDSWQLFVHKDLLSLLCNLSSAFSSTQQGSFTNSIKNTEYFLLLERLMSNLLVVMIDPQDLTPIRFHLITIRSNRAIDLFQIDLFLLIFFVRVRSYQRYPNHNPPARGNPPPLLKNLEKIKLFKSI